MLGLGGIGAVVGVFLFVQAVTAPATVTVLQEHLHYQTPDGPPWLLAFPYVAATCLPLVLSSQRFVLWFGVAMTLAMGASAAVDAVNFASVWCFFAALLSITIFVHYLGHDTSPHRIRDRVRGIGPDGLRAR